MCWKAFLQISPLGERFLMTRSTAHFLSSCHLVHESVSMYTCVYGVLLSERLTVGSSGAHAQLGSSASSPFLHEQLQTATGVDIQRVKGSSH